MLVSPGPAAAAFGKQHDRQLLLQRDAQHAVGLGMVAHALGAGEHGRVVSHHDAARGRRAELRSVDAGDAGDHAVGRRVGDQVALAAARALRSERERAVFDEAALVAQRGQVLACGTHADAAKRSPRP